MAKDKRLMICPFCDDVRAFTWQAVIMHVRSKHPEKLNDLKDNKETYLSKFGCDEFGNPRTPRTADEPPAEPPNQDPAPPEPPAEREAPKGKKKPKKEKPTPPKAVEKPAGDGFRLFRRRRS